MPTGPRKPIGAPVAFSIVAASAGDERRGAEGAADLGLVGLVVAPDQGGHGLAVGEEDQQLGRGRLVDLQELADLAGSSAGSGVATAS